MPDPIYVIIFVAILAVCIAITWFAAISYRKKVYESKIGSAEEKSR